MRVAPVLTVGSSTPSCGIRLWATAGRRPGRGYGALRPPACRRDAPTNRLGSVRGDRGRPLSLERGCRVSCALRDDVMATVRRVVERAGPAALAIALPATFDPVPVAYNLQTASGALSRLAAVVAVFDGDALGADLLARRISPPTVADGSICADESGLSGTWPVCPRRWRAGASPLPGSLRPCRKGAGTSRAWSSAAVRRRDGREGRGAGRGRAAHGHLGPGDRAQGDAERARSGGAGCIGGHLGRAGRGSGAAVRVKDAARLPCSPHEACMHHIGVVTVD